MAAPKAWYLPVHTHQQRIDARSLYHWICMPINCQMIWVIVITLNTTRNWNFLAKSGFYCPQWDHLPNQCPNERASLSSPTSLPSHLFSFIAAFNSSNLIWGMTQWRYHPSLQAVLLKLPPFLLWCPDRTAMEFHVPSPHHPCQLALYSCS